MTRVTLKIGLPDIDASFAQLREQSVEIRGAMNRAVIQITEQVLAAAKENASGAVLVGHTLRLRDSLQSRIDYFTKRTITGQVFSTLPYAQIQDQGGTIPGHVIPASGRTLAFEMPGVGIIFAQSVQNRGSRIPASGFLRLALEANREELSALVREYIAGRK